MALLPRPARVHGYIAEENYMTKYRKTNKAKRVDPGCRNNGSCPICTGNRMHSNKVREPIEELEEDVFDGCLHGVPWDEDCELCEEHE